MSNLISRITDLYNRIPRRHTTDNVKDIYALLDEYEDVLVEIEALPKYEKEVAVYFDELDPIRALVKKSTENKASKKQKDDYFDEASSSLKDTMDALRNFIEE